MDKNDSINEEIINITRGNKEEGNPSDEMYEVVSEYQRQPDLTQAAVNTYPHIFIKLCNGKIINAENGERIVNLSQFMAINQLHEAENTEEDPVSQLSLRLLKDSCYLTNTKRV